MTTTDTEAAEASMLDVYLPAPATITEPSKIGPPPVFPGVRSARLVGLAGRVATVFVRGDDQPQEVPLDPDVDAAIVREALENGERVMVEPDEDGELVVVGVLRSRKPETLRLQASVIEIDADQEVLVRSGRGAMRIREDGDIELIGSRISAASRGLFRLVGRMLRLN